MATVTKRAQTISGAESSYVLPYHLVSKIVGVNSATLPANLTLSSENLLALVKALLRGVNVNENWYRRSYPDVDAAIRSGEYNSAKHHFIENGYFEGRRPGPVVVDEEWYMEKYPDIAEGIEAGEIASCQEHFDEHGYAEGRLPREY